MLASLLLLSLTGCTLVGESDWAEANDRDGDGFLEASTGGDDCDDSDAAVHPGASESCNGVDDDCDGLADEAGAEGETTWYLDGDGDGFGVAGEAVAACVQPDGYAASPGDCDDADAEVSPGAPEIWYDGIDADCAGGGDYDADGDGHDSALHGGDDCDDADATIHPGASETWYDGVDSDCAGDSDFDADADGHDSVDHDGDDCDDSDASVGPGTAEVWYDGVDSDCDGASDYDADGDGSDSDTHGGDDCDDADSGVGPGVVEVWYDGVDSDCDGASDYDADGDGYDSDAHGGDDCDDGSADVSPGAVETWYDGVDSDCDGASDYDADGDGYESDGFGGDDCDDGDAARSPGVVEVCFDGVDDDCDGDSTECDGGGADATLSGGGAVALAVVGDHNGDGEVDLLVGDNEAGEAYIIGLGDSPDTWSDDRIVLSGVVSAEAADDWLAAAGDVDGDGYDDVLVSGWDSTYLVHGPVEAGALSSAAGLLVTGESGGWLTSAVAGGHDITGDSTLDLVVAAPSDGDGAVFVISSDLTGDVVAQEEYEGRFYSSETSTTFGESVAVLEDYTGDGVADVAVGDKPGASASGAVSLAGLVHVFEGGLASTASEDAWLRVSGPDTRVYLGGTVAGGDVDGDGYSDVLASTDAGALWVYLGPTEGDLSAGSGSSDLEYFTLWSDLDDFGDALEFGGDFDGDGWEDLVVGAPASDDSGGAALIFTGPLTDSVDPTFVVESDSLRQFGVALAVSVPESAGASTLIIGAEETALILTGAGEE
ncbi:MAG: FG-GAP repeat protein [Alphaproteobacteria bacterium]|nr:FG-GAP repeat protein [Alphaproteobacteria bacterium]